jgi:F-type H+-transporting ATPase subunit a
MDTYAWPFLKGKRRMINSMKEIEVGHFTIGKLFGLEFHLDTLLMSWLVMAILVGLSFIVTRRMDREQPHGAQNVLETIVEFLRNLMAENLGPAGRGAFPFVATLFLFILFSNLIGILVPAQVIPLKSPTEDLSFTLGLSILVFLSMIYYGIKVQGLKNYILSFFKPNFLFFPIHLIDFLIKPITLAFRLFGNIFAGAVFFMILFSLLGLVVPLVAQILGVFVGVIQAYLFMMLAMAYISSAMEEGVVEEGHPEPDPKTPTV